MKKAFLFLLTVLFISYHNIDGLENNTEQTIILTDAFMSFLPDVWYKITFNDGGITEGKTNSSGIFTVNTANMESFLLELDIEPSYYTDDDWQDFDLPDEQVDDYEIVYLMHPEDDVQVIESEDGVPFTVVEHRSFCDRKYTVTLESGKNYILVYQRGPVRRISE